MMSNPPSSLHQAPKLHRRQNSTPVVAFEAMRVSNSNIHPSQQQQRQNLHRRGLSFDQQNRSPIRRQPLGNMVSITNVAQQIGQQILREAQQQRATRPGQQQSPITDLPVNQQPECGIYAGSQPTTPYEAMTMNSIMQDSPQMQFASSQYYPPDVNSMQPAYQGMGIVDENNQNYFQHQPQHNPNAMFDARRQSHPDLRIQTGVRPQTPQDQIQNAQFPLTPPCTQSVHQTIQYSKSQLGSPVILSPLPVPMQRGRSLQDIIEHEESKPQDQPIVRQRPQSMLAAPSHPQSQSFEVADMPIPTTSSTSISSPTKTPLPQPAADYSSPLPFFDSTCGSPTPSLNSSQIPVLTSTQTQPQSGSQSPTRNLALSPRRMSISDLNLEPGIQASIQETHVALDDIAQFIDGPSPVDNKWTCTYDECGKRFGRKENIKSHVQTHLGDRAFRCDHCQKCFVRGHDLKRHAKIHTGSKPYPCLCGNAFARHDALTRHRQRGMCIGAFEGIVKKEVKRGRPRKHRPEMDDRVDKAARTRTAMNHMSGGGVEGSAGGMDMFDAYNSSASSCSYSSWGSPPTDTMDNLSMADQHSPFSDGVGVDIALFDVPGMGLNTGVNMIPGAMNTSGANSFNQTISFHPIGADIFSFTPPASPGYSTGQKPSPSHTHRSLTPEMMPETIQPAQTQRAGSGSPHVRSIQHGVPVIQGVPIISADTSVPATATTTTTRTIATPHHDVQTHSLPSLSQSGSSPPAEVHSFDFADLPISTAGMSMSALTAMAPMAAKLESDRNEFDAFFDIEQMDGEDEFFQNL